MNVLGPKGLMERLKSSGGKPNVVSFFSALISCILIFLSSGIIWSWPTVVVYSGEDDIYDVRW